MVLIQQSKPDKLRTCQPSEGLWTSSLTFAVRYVPRLLKSARLTIYAVDFFRPIRDRRIPLACFLSHVHSDHLMGLENKTFHGKLQVHYSCVASPIVILYSLYCSPATREILLRLQKYPHRLNFAKGILESEKLTYKHLEDRLVWNSFGPNVFQDLTLFAEDDPS